MRRMDSAGIVFQRGALRLAPVYFVWMEERRRGAARLLQFFAQLLLRSVALRPRLAQGP